MPTVPMNPTSSSMRPRRARSPWSCSIKTLVITAVAAILALAIAQSFLTRQRDPKGCSMSYMRPAFARFSDFDGEHTRLGKKYSLYLYREILVDEDTRVKGVPVLFIPGNAGSYKQVRPLAAQAALQYQNQLQNDEKAKSNGKISLDFFAVDFNEDFGAFHGQTLLDQAEYVNDAISYILALYLNPHRCNRDPDLPAPTSVILVGHSMGGIVARTAMTLADHQYDSVNTIITLATPHSRPPISFDADILSLYRQINNYWRHAYSHRLEANNPLWETTLISIAGGSLDTIVPSDYSTVASLVPSTHGFTVFTSSIPEVWTSMDHLAITWCNQLREVIVAALYDVIDAHDVSQTISREERMDVFRKRFLTGLEKFSQSKSPHTDNPTLLKIDSSSSIYASPDSLLKVQNSASGQRNARRAHLVAIPSQESTERDIFRLLTNQRISEKEDAGAGYFFCTVLTELEDEVENTWTSQIDLSNREEIPTKLSCVNTAPDAILLPSSYQWNNQSVDHYFEQEWNQLVHRSPPFSYLEYNLEDLARFEYFALVESPEEHSSLWAIAEFSSRAKTSFQATTGVTSLGISGLKISFPVKSLVNEIKLPSIHSSLFAFRIKIDQQACSNDRTLFAPLLRQHISDPYESKFSVNIQTAEISIHGAAPYIPIPVQSGTNLRGLSLQIWTDPTCNDSLNITLNVDIFGSLGKLWMRYRTMFATFPLLIVALVLRNQFSVYDQTGTFASFSESLDSSLRRPIPVVLIGLTLLGLALPIVPGLGVTYFRLGYAPEAFIDFTRYDLLLGLQDPFFWFLIPLFGILSIGLCVLLNYVVLSLTFVFAAVSGFLPRLSSKSTTGKISSFAVNPWRRRLLILVTLMVFVTTVIPYQFIYLVLCVVQVATCTRALKIAQESHAPNHIHFYNYAHSILILMLWILPINIPTLIVWIHNLAVHWLIPFTSHHSILSITPFIVLIETISTGNLIPQNLNNTLRHLTGLLLLFLGLYAAMFGVTYAYRLHDIASLICAWLAAMHMFGNGWSAEGLKQFVRGFDSANGPSQQKVKTKS